MVTTVGAARGSWIGWGHRQQGAHSARSQLPPCLTLPSSPSPFHSPSLPGTWHQHQHQEPGAGCAAASAAGPASTPCIFNYSSLRLQLSCLPFGTVSLCQFPKDPAGCFLQVLYQGFSDPAVGDALKCQGVVTYHCSLCKHPHSQSSFSAWPGNKD